MRCGLAALGRLAGPGIILFSLAVFASCSAWADSPVTSTPFAEAYLDYAAVRVARRSGIMTNQIAAYLAAPSTPLDVKAAVINALSWDIEGKHNADAYCRMAYRQLRREVDLDALRGDELLVLGYLVLMDDYGHPEYALPLLAQACRKLPKSYTVAMIHAIAQSQKDAFDGRDGVWSHMEAVTEDESLNGDMRIGALRVIMAYMELYRPTE